MTEAPPALDGRRWLIPFRSSLLPQVFCDWLVIGGGVAGLRAGIESASHGDTIVLAKEPLDASNTAWAQGGIASVRGVEDSDACHIQDTLTAGAGLCDERCVRTMVGEGREEVERLLSWGMRVDASGSGGPHLGLEGGHTYPRILHAGGDATGRELVRTLVERAQKTPGLRIFERCCAVDILTTTESGAPRAAGALTWHPRYGLQIIWARSVIIASGGAGQMYRETSNPRGATGDGIAMCWRAGAVVSDMEFIQFHPTTLYVAGAPRHLISEAVRGEGALLVDRGGRRIMPGIHPLADLAPRDVVSRAIAEHLAASGEPCAYLDARPIGARFAERFPGLRQMLAGYAIDPERDLIPIHPAAHYCIGGARVDLDGRTSVAGLLACGEAAASGVHGANRLASNSLLEGLVFGRRAALAAVADGPARPQSHSIESRIVPTDRAVLDVEDIRSSLRSAMWRNVAMARSPQRLTDVLSMCEFWSRYALDAVFHEPTGWDVQNMLTAAALITRAALERRESRGVHFRTDFPDSDPAMARHLLWRRGHTTAQRTELAASSGGRA